jgi:hypothetical protein
MVETRPDRSMLFRPYLHLRHNDTISIQDGKCEAEESKFHSGKTRLFGMRSIPQWVVLGIDSILICK